MHVKADGISPSVLAREEALNILSKVGAGFCCGEANEMLAYLDRLAPLDAAIAPASERPGTWRRLRSTILGGLFRT
ncbi:hypothetical protein [Mesorhizobium sp. B4-1-1]|uniref:hypothetical protein n=1 Tax=Mesorhizobium sp. B4-1-1 TaxID=2589890 RepID=UPI0015E3B082|nr:hypothetical protein [Mesorhizobium sp. B4-1-1]